MKRMIVSLLAALSLPSVSAHAGVRNTNSGFEYPSITAAVVAASSGDTLLISTGAYAEVVNIVSKDLTLDGGYDGAFTGKVGLLRSYIGGSPLAGSILDITNSHVTLRDLDISGAVLPATSGGGIDLEGSCVVSARNCRVFSNTAGDYGGGVNVNRSELYLNKTTVFSNYASGGRGGGIAVRFGLVDLYTNSSVSANEAEAYGGGIFGEQASIVIHHTGADVVGNTADFGGGIAVWSNSAVILTANADVGGNTAQFAGGGIYLGARSTVDVSASGTYIGYASADLGMNRVTNGSGGGVYAVDSTVRITDEACVAHNWASTKGGGVYLSNSVLLVDYADVGEYAATRNMTNYAGSYGGGIYAVKSTVDLTNEACVNLGLAGDSGGGIYAATSSVRISGNSIVGDANAVRANVAASNGGGIYLYRCDLAVIGSEIRDNQCDRSGGGIYMEACNDFLFTNSLLIGNVASNVLYGKSGGACLYSTGAMSVCDSSIISNTAGRDYGGLMWEPVFVSRTGLFYRVDLKQNRAGADAGGVYVGWHGTLRVEGCDVDQNVADSDSNGVGMGGGFFIDEGGAVQILAGSGTRIRRNSAADGGGVLTFMEAQLFMIATNSYSISIVSNTATRHGGGVCAPEGYSKVYAYGDIRWLGNAAGDSGGGIYASNDPSIYISSAEGLSPVFLRNTAGTNGGALCVSGETTGWGELTLIGAEIGRANEGNRALDYGGGVAVFQGVTFAAQDVQFVDNVAGNQGGALALCDAAGIIQSGMEYMPADHQPLNRFVANAVTNGGRGGAVYIENSGVMLREAVLVSNTASFGAAVYAGANAALKAVNLLIYTNVAGSTGGIRANASTVDVINCTIACNPGGGIETFTNALFRLTNCVVGLNARTNVQRGMVVSYSDIEDGYAGTGNISGNPQFMDSDAGDFRLRYGSPCIDGGIYNAESTEDCLGEPRPIYLEYDMGAFEYDGTNTDTDADGMNDYWEVEKSLNPVSATDALVDVDGDFVTNLYEYVADTDPHAIDDFLQIGEISNHVGVGVGFVSSARREYSLEYADALHAEVWTPVDGQTNIMGIGGWFSLMDSAATATNRQYRLRVRIP